MPWRLPNDWHAAFRTFSFLSFFNLCVFQVKGEALNKETLNFSRENWRYSPENEHIFWLEDYFPFEMVPFQGRHSFISGPVYIFSLEKVVVQSPSWGRFDIQDL